MTLEPLEQRMLLNAAPPNPHGLFPGEQFPVGEWPMAIAVGDLNDDGVSDVVTANLNVDLFADDEVGNGSVSVLLGNEDGTYSPDVPYEVGMLPASVAIDDFNNDGASDLVAANVESNDISVL
ncbi:MAG: VCBS repeat-containing protein, partial [bacterium]|nr:VCBS repeat-containing protein [bacterium]